MHKITVENLRQFRNFLICEEKAEATIEKYMRDIGTLAEWLCDRELTKENVLEYKQYLIAEYSPASVNSMISSINSYFSYFELHELRIKTLKIQQSIFADSERELSKDEYKRLVAAAMQKNNERLSLVMQTICATGIRVSELRFITVESLKRGRASIKCKGKIRTVFITEELCELLGKYIKEKKIKSGSVFVSKGGKPLNRSNIWSDMKKLCESAGVKRSKVFPHNLRHLFARTYYSVHKDIVRLADILGHSSVNTTRIYTMETGEVHQQNIKLLGLVMRC